MPAGKKREYQFYIDLKNTVENRGGKWLSPIIQGMQKVKIQCGCSNIWNPNIQTLIKGSWCPRCSSSLSERIVRKYFEDIFGYNFPKVRPDWLKNNTGYSMELDGFCEELGIAFEHNGQQHYEYSSGFHSSVEDFKSQQARDSLKIELCKKNGIKLFVIDRLFKKTPVSHLRETIVNQANSFNICINKNAVVNIDDAYKNTIYVRSPFDKSRMEEAKKIAIANNGLCLSDNYSHFEKMLWKCLVCNTEWKACGRDILNRGTWCKNCYRMMIERNLVDLASRCNLELIREEGKKLGSRGVARKWKCLKCNFYFYALAGVVKGWKSDCCPRCRPTQRKVLLQDFIDFAEGNGGKCLTTNYINNKQEIIFECNNGHQFSKMGLAVIANKAWCPDCKIEKRKLAQKTNPYQRKYNHKTKKYVSVAKPKVTTEKVNKKIKSIEITQNVTCLTEKGFIKSEEKLEWQCNSCSDIFTRKLKGDWKARCNKCKAAEREVEQLAFYQKFAAKRGGKCLSTSYISVKKNLDFECIKGHKFSILARRVKHDGSWCRECRFTGTIETEGSHFLSSERKSKIKSRKK